MQNWRKPIYMLLTLCMLFSFGMQLPVGAAVQSGAVKASTETTDNPVDYAVDSDTSTAWMCDTIDADIWFWMDLGSVQEIAGVDLNLYNNDYIESYTIEVSQDENSWTQVAERYTPGQMESETFDEIEARYLRWSAIMDDECTDSIGLYEIIVQEAKKPEPTPTASAAPSQTPSSNQFQDIPADVSGTQYEEAIYNLMSVGVISGYLDGTYRPDNTMTRAEFAVVAVRAMGYDDILPQQTQSLFYDVPSTHWAAPSIELLTQMGYLDGYGDRMFGPDDDITYGQVIKILTDIVGYRQMAQANGGFPMGYYIVASRIGILDNASTVGIEEPALRGETAVLIYNAMLTDVAEETGFGSTSSLTFETGKNLFVLGQNREIMRGIVTATYLTALNGGSPAPIGYIGIDGEFYQTELKGTQDLLGKQVIYTLQEEAQTKDKMVVDIYEASARNNEVCVYSDDVIEVSTGRFSYVDESGKRETITFADGITIIYNGEALPNYTLDDLQAAPADFRFLDNNKDGRYEVLFIDRYESFVVKSVASDQRRIYLKSGLNSPDEGGASYIEIDPDGKSPRNVIMRSGEEAEISSLKENEVINVLRGKSGNTVTIVVSPIATVQGMVEEISDRNVVIDGTTYRLKIADLPNEGEEPAYLITVGKQGTFYLDQDGRICGSSLSALSGGNYAYLLKVAGGKGIDPTPEFQVYTTEGKLVILQGASSIKLNDTKSAVITETTLVPEQLIYYRLNDAGEVDLIETAEDLTETDKVSASEFTLNYKGELTYTRPGLLNGNYITDNTTIMMAVPTLSEGQTYEEVESSFRVGSAALTNRDKFEMEVYNVNNDNKAGFVVARKTGKSNLDDADSAIVVTSVVKTLLPDGSQGTKLLGYIQERETEIILDPEGSFTDQFGVGDIIQHNLDSNNYMHDAAGTDYRILYSPDKSYIRYSQGGREYDRVLETYEATVERTSNGYMYLSTIEDDPQNVQKKSLRMTGSAFELSADKMQVDKINIDDIQAGDHVFVHTRYNTPISIMIIR